MDWCRHRSKRIPSRCTTSFGARVLAREDIAKAHEVTKAVDDVVASDFTSGYEGLAAVKRKYADEAWFHQIEGEFTGEVLKADEQTLRTKGRDLYDNLQIDWHYDALGWMRKLNIPQLWILAGADRDAPNGLTLQRLALLQREGKPIQVMIFPHTDHGIQEFTEAPDGTRTDTKTADGYYPMIGDWIKGQWRPPYGELDPNPGDAAIAGCLFTPLGKQSRVWAKPFCSLENWIKPRSRPLSRRAASGS